MGSFSIALTGLEADTVSLNTIGNNLANINTTAFKEQSTTFEDLFYQQIGTSGSNNPIQVGVGTRVSGTDTNLTQGSISTTSTSTDMALQGNGYFVVQQNGVQSLTRAGNFQLDSSGNLTTADGQSVMGYAATNGVVNENGGLVALTVPVGVTEAAKATQNFSVTANLNASATTGTSFTSPVTMYDSLGESHSATITYTKIAANTWGYSVTLPAADATGTPVNNTGTLAFDSSGTLVFPSSNISGITFPGLTDGASDMTVNFNLYTSGSPTISQSTAASSTTTTTQDGYASGTYQSFTVGTDGVITASFSNSQTEKIGQVAVATVTNQQGLVRSGSNNYTTTAASGVATVGVAGTGGRGTITDSALEQSNVDISTEFANLIVAQRAFQANSKTITTFDSLTQDVMGMVR
ncbi:MAG TPA: flagellar hook protein FlgE [Edaphobacter sp.]|jgi:flagellar hook protein FlgE|nr:flagellar hook protein FlgE [Edaphobacter sp.]